MEQKYVNRTSIQFITGPLAGQIIPIQKACIEIGRDAQNDIVVPDPKVSRRHARLCWLDKSWTIVNLSQNSFVSIDQQYTQQGVLAHNSVVNLGKDTSFVCLLPAGIQPSEPIEIVPQPQLLEPMGRVPQPLPPRGSVPPPPPVGRAFLNIPEDASPSGTVLATSVPSLVITSNIHSNQQVYILKAGVQTFTLGRDPASDIVIDEPVISGLHAQIIREDGQLIFVHPHPARGRTLNGLWYQGRRFRGDEPFRKPLMPGDIFRVGDEHGTIVTMSYDDGKGLPVGMMSTAMRPTPLNDRLAIGRASDNTLVLNHPQVSAHHAMLLKVEGGYSIIDTNSTNHVYVNNDLVTNQLLRTGDEIRIGPYRLTYTGTELRPYDESNNIRIDALHLKKMGNKDVILLNDISLVIPPRKFVAIVGGSGAGKSTLMDALNGLRPAHEGTVQYNGVDYYRNLASFSTQLGYVPQEDIVHRELTVERALYYAARLRLPSDFTGEQIQWRIDEVLEDVEMTERRKLLVSKLSGGQRKRVSIALELLANPGVFFLDEPTSGLDPGLDRKMMSLLRKLADRGRTIVLVTHATNNINACDYVCFLAQGGRLAYFGPPNEAKQFFEKTDFAEIYSALEPSKEQRDIPLQAESRFLASKDYQRYVAEPLEMALAQDGLGQGAITDQRAKGKTQKRVSRGNPWSQFMLLSLRYLELLKNDVGNLLILLLQAPVIAIMLVLMVRFEVGVGVFDANKLVQCRTQILTSSGPLALPEAKTIEQTNCNVVQSFLRSDPNGQDYARKKGGQDKALQDFILPGPGADAQKVLFIMAFATVLFGCINGAREIVKEDAIYKRERTVNLGIMPYMFSKIAVLGLLSLLQSAVLVLVVQAGEPLQQGIILPPLLETYVTLALTSLAGLMVGLTISSIAPNNDRAISFVPIILIPQVIFSGAIIPLKDWLTQVLATVFPTRWAMAALGSSIGLHADKIGGDKLFGDDFTYHSRLFSVYSQADATQRLLVSWIALGVITIVLMIVVGIFLKLKDKRA
ncbi:MAG: hypothetical protein NVSMB44_39930 [Ktedonobacteraceae bacterium]